MAIKQRELHITKHQFTREGQTVSIETGLLAPEADGAVKISFGENVFLVTAVMEKRPNPSMDFLPLMVDFREAFSAAGRLAGAAYRRREGRPGTNIVLYCRLTDRTIRPLFPKGMINDVIVSITPLALDQQQDLGVLSIIGSSLAIQVAGIPFAGPAGAVRIGRVDGQFVINPTKEQIEKGEMNLLVAGPRGLVNMIECDAKEVDEAVIKEAFALAAQHIETVCNEQDNFMKKVTVQPKTITYNKPSQLVLSYVKGLLTEEWKSKMFDVNENFNELYYVFEREVLTCCKDKIAASDNEDFTEARVKLAVFDVLKHEIRDMTLNEGKRMDGRAMDEIRPIHVEVDTLPRVHGSGLFRRGGTQVLSTVTLGAPSEYLIIDDMEFEQVHQRYMHHYNFPPFSTNEAKGTRGAGRREIGHGALAEKALEHVLPSKEDFPYTMRVVSDCLSSGGSTSMGSVCGSTLSLMAAGVPLKAPVSGIAMGLISESDDDGKITKYQVITDLKGTEDFIGDMDFKVAGTKKGITAIQLDTKIKGLTTNMVYETIAKADIGRNEILEFMLKVIPEPRKETSQYAPKIVTFKIAVDKIRDVIGRGGEVINKIIEAAGGVKIDFEDDGSVFIADKDLNKIRIAEKMIRDIAEDLPLNQEINGKILRVEAYGVFVELPGGKNGLVHVSQLDVKRGIALDTVYKVGDTIKIMVTEIDEKGRYNLKKVV